MKFELSHFPVSTAALAGGAGVQRALSLPSVDQGHGTAESQNDGNGISVCHLSPVKGRLDARTYNMEILPAVKHGVRAALVGPHGTEHHEEARRRAFDCRPQPSQPLPYVSGDRILRAPSTGAHLPFA